MPVRTFVLLYLPIVIAVEKSVYRGRLRREERGEVPVRTFVFNVF